MAKEIERKFLLADKTIVDRCESSAYICQAYISDRPDATVRVRICDKRAFLTIKSKNTGIERHEWEYEIPVRDAHDIIEKCHTSGLIEKTRYRLGSWEIDIFHGRLEGLAIAEIELADPHEVVDLPGFIGKEVSDDYRYFNSILATEKDLPPFC